MAFRSKNRGLLRAGIGINVPSEIEPFDPLSIAGLASWWDASDTTSISHSSNQVSQINDKSGNARHLISPGGGAAPITNTRTMNNLNVLDFDGVDDRMYCASFWYSLGDSTSFIVFQLDADPNPSGGLGNGGLMYEWHTSNWPPLYGTRTYSAAAAPPDGGYGYLYRTDSNTIPYNMAGSGDPTNGSSHLLWTRDTTTLAETQLNQGTIVSATYTRSSASLNRFGLFYTDGPENGYTYRGNNGVFAEALIYNSALSNGNRDLVITYLKAKWATV